MKNKLLLTFGLIFAFANIVSAQTSTKTVTNDDLAKFRVKRESAEAEYRAKYKELGMPSPEELEQRRKESERTLADYSTQKRAERQQNQDYWQARANNLRNEIVNVNAQINYLNAQISSLPNQNQVGISTSQIVGIGSVPYGYGRGRVYQQRRINPANNVQTVINASAGNPNPYYGTPLYPNSIKVVIGDNDRYGRPGNRGNYGYGGYYPYVSNGNSSQAEELNSRLQYLGQVRAGLTAQWDSFVNEAYRAGFRVAF
jgi:hypothetical protein